MAGEVALCPSFEPAVGSANFWDSRGTPRRCVGAVPPLPSAGGGGDAGVPTQPQRARSRVGGSGGASVSPYLRVAAPRRRLGALPRFPPCPFPPLTHPELVGAGAGQSPRLLLRGGGGDIGGGGGAAIMLASLGRSAGRLLRAGSGATGLRQ